MDGPQLTGSIMMLGWLNTWWNKHNSELAGSGGFANSFGQYALGNPDWSCRDDGSDSDCDLEVCDQRVLYDLGSDLRPAYYVLESVKNLHGYFLGMSETYEAATISAALSKDKWAYDFYVDKDANDNLNKLKEALNFVNTFIGFTAAFGGLASVGAGAATSAAAALFGGAIGSQLVRPGHEDDTPQKAAALGAALNNAAVSGMKSFTSINNALMAGQQPPNYKGDIRNFLSGGVFDNFHGIDKNALLDRMNVFLIGYGVNALWRQMKVFILGGAACDQDQGIGEGPKAYSVCRDGKQWFLYYWHEGNRDPFSRKQWGYVALVPGSDKLNKEDYSGVTVEDVINSSLDSYNVAQYDYNSDTAAKRAQSALADGWRNPMQQGPSWEGTFTIPVCDVSATVRSDIYGKNYILEEYGEDARPMWCGNICSNSESQTAAFIKAANMGNFESPVVICEDKPGWFDKAK